MDKETLTADNRRDLRAYLVERQVQGPLSFAERNLLAALNTLDAIEVIAQELADAINRAQGLSMEDQD